MQEWKRDGGLPSFLNLRLLAQARQSWPVNELKVIDRIRLCYTEIGLTLRWAALWALVFRNRYLAF